MPKYRIAFQEALRQYLNEFINSGYGPEDFLKFAKASLDDARLLERCAICYGPTKKIVCRKCRTSARKGEGLD